MANYSVWILEESNVSVTGGQTLDGITQGDGSNLDGEFITLNSNDWLEVKIRDNGSDDTFDDNDGNQRLDGAQTIDGITYADGTRVEAEYRIEVTDPSGNVYEVIGFNVQNSSPAYGTVEGLVFVGQSQAWPPIGVPLEVTLSAEGPGSSGQPSIPAEDLVVPCFTPGVGIETAAGFVPVETLELGDMVRTLDHGLQPIRWIGQVRLNAAQLVKDPSLRPILVRADAFGLGHPHQDILLSPQHRVLLGGWRMELVMGSDEGLAAIVHLVNDHGILRATDRDEVTYIHLMFDRHEVVCADGLWAESFRPGPMTLSTLQDDVQKELLKLFPELGQGQAPAMPAARPMLKKWEVALLAAPPCAPVQANANLAQPYLVRS